MRSLVFLIVWLISCPSSVAWSQTVTFHAGIARISVAADTAFDALVWYPTQAQEGPWQIGPFSIPAGHNATIAGGQFPVVLLSHGGGATGGSPLLLRDLSASLAREGFIVVAPFHGKVPLATRTVQMNEALDAALSDPRFKSHAIADRLGMLGFSLGGAVVLRLAGAIPDIQVLAAYCSSHPDDVQSCHDEPKDGKDSRQQSIAKPAAATGTMPNLSPKALVLLDPFSVLFSRNSLSTITLPVLLFRPKDSRQGEENMHLLATGLGQPPNIQYISGGHFIFTDVCSSALKTTAGEVCEDPPGVDRAAIQARSESQIVEFFREHL